MSGAKRTKYALVDWTSMPKVLLEQTGAFLSVVDLAKLPCVTARWKQFAVPHLSLDFLAHGIGSSGTTATIEDVSSAILRLIDVSSLQTLLVQDDSVSYAKSEFTMRVAQGVIDRACQLRCLRLRGGYLSFLHDYNEAPDYNTRFDYHKRYHKRFQLDLGASSIRVVDAPASTLCFIKRWPAQVDEMMSSTGLFCLVAYERLKRIALGDEDEIEDDNQSSVGEEDRARLASLRSLVFDLAPQRSMDTFWATSFYTQSHALLKPINMLRYCLNLERCDIKLDLRMIGANLDGKDYSELLGCLSRYATCVELKTHDTTLEHIHVHPELALGKLTITASKQWKDEPDYFLWRQRCVKTFVSWRDHCRKLASRPKLHSVHFHLNMCPFDTEKHYLDEFYQANPMEESIQWQFLRHLVVTDTPVVFWTSLLRDLPALETLIVGMWKGEHKYAVSSLKGPIVMPKLSKAVFPSHMRYARLIEAIEAPLLQDLWLLGDLLTTDVILPRVPRAAVYLKESSTKPMHPVMTYGGNGRHMDRFEGFLERNKQLPCVELVRSMDFLPRRGTKWTVTGARMFANEDIRRASEGQPVDPLLEQAVALLFDD